MKKLLIFSIYFLAVTFFLQATEIIVTSANDDPENVPENSLRDALIFAQSGDIIKFSIPGTDEIILLDNIAISGENKVLIIDGMNAATGNLITLKKDESSLARMFNIGSSGDSPGLSVTFKNIIVSDAYAETNGPFFSSGHSAYKTAGDIKIILENCWFKNCTSAIKSTSNGGGGVCYLSHGTELTILNCLFENNKMIFSDKEGFDTAKSSGGGAIGSTGDKTAKLIIVNSTFSQNYSGNRGGAIYIGHPTVMINCTLSGNKAAWGAGFYLHTSTHADIVNSIITHNYVGERTDRSDLYKYMSGATINTIYSVIGKTTVDLGTGSDLYDPFMPLFQSYSNNDSIPVLADNQGLTPTIALSPYGVATANGIATPALVNLEILTLAGFEIPSTDQRGATRSSAPCRGAYEYGGDLSKVDAVVNDNIFKVINKQIVLNENVSGTIGVYNISGEEVSRNKTDLSTLPTGIYIVRFIESKTNDISILKVAFQ